MVGFEQYQAVLLTAQTVLPDGCRVTLLADRGFEHRALLRWLQQQNWDWYIRVKSDLCITLSNGRTCSVADLFPHLSRLI